MTSQPRRVLLGDVVNLKRGYDLPKRLRIPGHVPIVSSSGVSGTHNESKVKGPGVVTGRYGTLGKVFYIESDYWPLNTTLYVQDFKGNNRRFICYFLKTLEFASQNAAGAVPGVNRNHLHKLEVQIPPLSTQRKIASILSIYDDLIDVNIHRIAILEEMARKIYREWFINFRFPGHESVDFIDSSLGRIPEGWTVSSLGNISQIVKEKYNDDHSELPLLDLKKMLQKTILAGKMGSPDELTTSRIIFDENDILFGSIRPYLHKVSLAPCKGVTNTSVFVIRTENPLFLAMLAVLLSSKETIEWANQYSTGTKMPVIKWGLFSEMPVVQPDDDILLQFQKVVWPMLQIIKVESDRIQRLRDTQELLLPKLISGALDVEDIDIDVTELIEGEGVAA